MEKKTYLSIDLKSFYASVECMERGLDPMTTNLVVADESRTEKTICLAVSPSLRSYGIPGRVRLFEVIQKVKGINVERKNHAPGKKLTGFSYDQTQLSNFPDLGVDYLVAPPRMARYMELSTQIYHIYLKYVAPEDIHVYSIDEVFIDITQYLKIYHLTARELAEKMIMDVLETTGITATAGIGTNLYLSKVAMDIVAKHIPADNNGVRIAELDEMSYRRKLWSHRPLTSFWRVGKGYAEKLEKYGLYTMGDIARCSLGGKEDFYNEDLLYRLFGVNAELLIDHAWGWEPCTMADIKAYQPVSNSVGSGQVLADPYPSEKAKMVVREMTDLLVLSLVEKGLATNQITLTIGYDRGNLKDPKKREKYQGEVTVDQYGRMIPKHAHGTENLERYSSSTRQVTEAAMRLFDRIINPALLVRRLTLTANHVIRETSVAPKAEYQQLDLFTDYQEEEKRIKKEQEELEREKRMQKVMLSIKQKYGKNAILKGINLQEGATTRERNRQIGGHKA